MEVPLIHDAAQAFGAKTSNGLRLGDLPGTSCVSFYPTKALGAFGDAGLTVTNSPLVAELLRQIRTQGGTNKYNVSRIGGNFRIDALQAAFLRKSLQGFAAASQARSVVADRYVAGLAGIGGGSAPIRSSGSNDSYFVVLADERDSLLEHLKSRGIGCSVYYPTPLHMQPAFRDLGYAMGDFPVAESVCDRSISLPIYPGLSLEQQDLVIDEIGRFYAIQ